VDSCEPALNGLSWCAQETSVVGPGDVSAFLEGHLEGLFEGIQSNYRTTILSVWSCLLQR
jgi:hypothetical protein